MSGKQDTSKQSTSVETAAVTSLPDSFSSGKQPVSGTPHSQDAERAILGALLLDNRLVYEIDTQLNRDMFYVPAHGRVYDAISKLVGLDKAADPVSLTAHFGGNADWFEDLGGRQFLEELHENATKIISVKTYADIIYNNYIAREMISIGTELAGEAAVKGSEFPKEVMDAAESRLFTLADKGTGNRSIKELKEALIDVIRSTEIARKSGTTSGVTTGYIDLDKLLGGWQRSDLVILAARPSMGKTAFALNLALNAAKAKAQDPESGAAVAIFSLEMSAEQLAARLLSSESAITTDKMAQGKLSNGDFTRLAAASDDLSQLPLYIDETPALHINSLRNRARRLKRQYDVGLIIVDYLQLMVGDMKNSEGRVQEISRISQGLKAIARELDVPVIALSQLSRAVESRENKRPQLSDLRESGSIEQDADIVMFLYRDAYYKEREMGANPTPEQQAQLEPIKNESEVNVSKNRKGPTGGVKLLFDGATTSFRDYISSGH